MPAPARQLLESRCTYTHSTIVHQHQNTAMMQHANSAVCMTRYMHSPSHTAAWQRLLCYKDANHSTYPARFLEAMGARRLAP